MTKHLGAATLVVLLLASGAARAADDGFAAFWAHFSAAARTDDTTTLAKLVQMGPALSGEDKTFAQFHASVLGPKTRACLAKSRPDRNPDDSAGVNYFTVCSGLLFAFSHTAAGWRLTDMNADD